MKIAVTGSSGLIGRTLTRELEADGYEIVKIDIRNPGYVCDIANKAQLHSTLDGCEGIIHLAAVSRVAEAQEHPIRTWQSNVEGTSNVLNAVLEQQSERRPWLIHASSREVYGNQPQQAIDESTPMNPLNIYGRSKAACETLIHSAQDAGANVSILRFANVYGDIFDYPDRVIPAFSSASAQGTTLRVDDARTCMDFTHVDDVAQGIAQAIKLLELGENNLPPIHFATGEGTTLGTLAQMAVKASGNVCEINEVAARKSSVSCFIGDPARARELLGWEHQTSLDEGFSRMVDGYIDEFSEQSVRPAGNVPTT